MMINETRMTDVVMNVEWRPAAQDITRYATHMFIQRSENEFVLSFYELQPPLVFASEEVTAAQGVCVARIVVSPQHMAEIVEMFGKIPLED